jgi:pimeloyl-ACP methyl ester carboxylesterase
MEASAPAAGSARTLLFSHANGFPAGTYRVLFEAWQAAGWRVIAVPRYGHDPRWPVTSNWRHLRDELLALADTQAPGERVVLVGHSLGGFLSLLAAAKRPALARAVVLLDSPLIAGWRAHSVRMMKLSGLMRRLSPGKVSATRRWQWPSPEAVRKHFEAKTAFARWAPEVLSDYLAAGFEPDPDAPPPALRLAFRREVETAIYQTLPHHLHAVLRKRPLRAPVAYIGGTRSVEGRQAGLAATRALVHGRLAWIEGSHLYPMEQPLITAQAVLRQIASAANP